MAKRWHERMAKKASPLNDMSAPGTGRMLVVLASSNPCWWQ